MPSVVHRVLLVEDDDGTREGLAELLEIEGFAVEPAADGEEALARLRSGAAPCIILLDLMMPRMDGMQFREAQLADGRFATIPVVILSGAGHLEPRAAQLGVRVYAEKPPDVRRLCAILAGCCTHAIGGEPDVATRTR